MKKNIDPHLSSSINSVIPFAIKPNHSDERGQVLIEYILLLLIGIMIANILVKQLTGFSDDPENRGVVIQRWMKLWDSIGSDTPDK